MGEIPQRDFEQAAAVLAGGGVVVYPTETFYGLGVDAASGPALARLAALKGRDAGKAVSVLVSSRAMLRDVAASISDVAERLIARFWPGALTIVFPARPEVSPVLTGGRGTIGARISSHALAQALVERLGRPLTATSANPGGEPPAARVEDARRSFGDRVDFYLDGGVSAGGLASTVIDCSGAAPVLLRAGAIDARSLSDAAGVEIKES